ncbi:uncharacterized protein BXIN_1186 [Babesia sp. Xinjiang]|uniref:uncharacterized protein n=1 Tax=Babesia sp. Xinjiang TaxID=462227 RepID=UPI000A218D8B|nr:uncharacterized protein BXIN_1186 [Babesia sp. Xinjiang]ORM40032.1 hypothetical protein BXIN_1186 [Babesia sp. Xinjiang]
MLAGCCGGTVHSPVFGAVPASAEVSNTVNIVGNAEECLDKGPEGIEKCQLPEGALMGIIFNLEQERETYLEAVAVLHEQLLEAHEHCQQLADSHQQIKRNLEAEVSEGWKEAERWEARYRSVAHVARCVGVDVVELQKQMEASAGDRGDSNHIVSERSMNSEACTVVTREDLYRLKTDKGTDEDVKNAQHTVYDTVTNGIQQINSKLDSAIHKNGHRGTVGDKEPLKAQIKAKRSIFNDQLGVIVNGDDTQYKERELPISMNRRTTRVPTNSRKASIFTNAVNHKPLGNLKGCFCLTPMGSPCVRCGSSEFMRSSMGYTEPIPTLYHDWLYLTTPRDYHEKYESSHERIPSADIIATLNLVFDVTSI